MNPTPIKILTINTWKGDGNYRKRMLALQNQLKTLDPDIIACQEVFQTKDGSADTGKALAEFLEMHYHFVPARLKNRHFEEKTQETYSGLGLLSKFPITKTEVLELPTDERDGERITLFCEVNFLSIPILVINTHLTYLFDASQVRKQQIETILKYLSQMKSYQTVFICGDFNATPDSQEIRFLLNNDLFSVENTYTAGNGKLPGYTMIDRKTSHKIPKGNCIDYIFSLTGKHNYSPEILNAVVILDEPDAEGNFPSDHCGVMIQTQL